MKCKFPTQSLFEKIAIRTYCRGRMLAREIAAQRSVIADDIELFPLHRFLQRNSHYLLASDASRDDGDRK